MNETDWFPQYYNKENRERYASASSPSPRLLFDQWAHSCVGRQWEIRHPQTTSGYDRNCEWVEVVFASYIPSDQSPLDSQTPSFLRSIVLAARRSGKFTVQKCNDQGELLPEKEALHLSPDCVRPSLTSWKNRAKEIISAIFSSSEEEMAKNNFETSSIQDEIHSSVNFTVSLSVPLSDDPLGLQFRMNKDSNIELGSILPDSIASRSMALLPGDILVKCSSINALWKNSPCAFVVEENDCTMCQNEGIVAAYVKSHKDFPHVSPYVRMTFRRTLKNLVSLHIAMGNNNIVSSADSSLGTENSILQNSYEALKRLLLLKARFNKRSVTGDLESDNISSQLATLLNCYTWLFQGENIRSMLPIGKEGRKNDDASLTFEKFCQHVKLGNNLVPELNRIFALHKPSNSFCWFLNKLTELHAWLSREFEPLLMWVDTAEKMVTPCTNPKNDSYFEVHEMIQTLEQATCVDRNGFLSLATKFEYTKKLVDSLARKVFVCKAHAEKLKQTKEQFTITPPTSFNATVSSSLNSLSSSASACSITDPVLQSLHEIHKEISSQPELSNVKDFVTVSHLLEARKWAMKSMYALNTGALLRERLTFYQDLIETASKNKNDWAELHILPLISEQWKKIPEIQVKVDFTVLVGDIPELQKETTIMEAEEYLSIKLLQDTSVVTSPMLKESLSLLSRFPVLCILEEKILVWLDVMQLTELLQSDKKGAKMSLGELLQLLEGSSLIHDGKSPQRCSKVKDLTPNANADVEVRKFSTSFDGAVSCFQETAKQWAAEAEQWRASARQFLNRFWNNSAELVRIRQLLTMHNNLHVCINEEYNLLLQQVHHFHMNENNADDKSATKEKSAVHKARISAGQDYTDADSCGSKCDPEKIRENGAEINYRSRCDHLLATNSARHVLTGKVSANGKSEQSTSCDDVDNGFDSDLFSTCTQDNESDKKDFYSERFVAKKRDIVLDCLLKRKALSDESVWSNKREKTSKLASIQDSDLNLFHRAKARRHLTKCFMNGVHELGLPESLHLCHEFCCFLAWRLERIVYKKYPWNMSSDEGEDKRNYNYILRCLKSNLKSNRTLCASVLVGNTNLSSLVDFSPKELASKHMLNQREKGAKQAEKQRVLDANDSQFGMVGLLNQKRSSFINAAAEKEESTNELGLFLHQKGNHTSQGGTLETPDKSLGSLMGKIIPEVSTVEKKDSEVESSQNGSYLKHSMTSDNSLSRVSDLLRLEEPNEREHRPLLNVHLPVLEADVGGRSQDFANEQDEEKQLLSEPDESDDDEVTHITPSNAYEETGYQHISPEAPATNIQELQAATTVGFFRQIKPKGGGSLFSFLIKGKIVSNFKAFLFLDKNPEFITKIEDLLPYLIEEKRTCDFENLREFINRKKRERAHDIIFCRLSFSNTEIINQEKYKAFRRRYEEKGRVAILQIPGSVMCVYLLVPKLLKLLVEVDGISGLLKEKIASTHLMLIVAKSEKA